MNDEWRNQSINSKHKIIDIHLETKIENAFIFEDE